MGVEAHRGKPGRQLQGSQHRNGSGFPEIGPRRAWAHGSPTMTAQKVLHQIRLFMTPTELFELNPTIRQLVHAYAMHLDCCDLYLIWGYTPLAYGLLRSKAAALQVVLPSYENPAS
jgi:hypothetical protein